MNRWAFSCRSTETYELNLSTHGFLHTSVDSEILTKADIECHRSSFLSDSLCNFAGKNIEVLDEITNIDQLQVWILWIFHDSLTLMPAVKFYRYVHIFDHICTVLELTAMSGIVTVASGILCQCPHKIPTTKADWTYSIQANDYWAVANDCIVQ